MKNFDINNYQLHLRDLKLAETTDPFLPTTYLRGAFDIANSFITERSGTLSRLDILQECYYALLVAWDKMDWDAIRKAKEPKAYIWSYLKTTIKFQARDMVIAQMDGQRVPKNKFYEITETKNVYNFLTQLFPNEYFADNDEKLDLIDYSNNLTSYDNEQLGLALEDVFRDFLTTKETVIVMNSFGINTDKLSAKKIADNLRITVSNVNKTKFVALNKLKNDDVKLYLQEFYDFG